MHCNGTATNPMAAATPNNLARILFSSFSESAALLAPRKKVMGGGFSQIASRRALVGAKFRSRNQRCKRVMKQHRTFDRDDVAIGEGPDWATAFIRSVPVDPGVKVDTK